VPLLRDSQIPTQQTGVVEAGPQPHAGGFRVAIGTLGGILLLIAIWCLATDLLRPNIPNDSLSWQGAARVGVIGTLRGDAWRDNGVTPWAKLLAGGQGEVIDPTALASTRDAVVQTLRYSPHLSRAWLLLAEVESRLGAAANRTASALKMSYYTGPNDPGLIPTRIVLAAQPRHAQDAELRSLLENEIGVIAQSGSIRPLLAQAYRRAGPDVQQVLRELVSRIDSALAEEMQAATAKP
jgi:hypothetical protein